MSKKILVTGGAGYIGSHTVHYLLNEGLYHPEDIIVFDNLVYGHREFVPEGVTFIKGDLVNKEDIYPIFRSEKIDGVIHFAAYALVGDSMVNPGKYFDNNILGGLNLLEGMLLGHCQKIVFSSTCATYGIPGRKVIVETLPTKPINPYGESKLIFEKILEWYYQIHKVKSVRLRYFNAAGAAYGIGEAHQPESHLIPLTIRAALSHQEVKVFGTDYPTPDGTCVRDYIHVLDLAAAHYASLRYLDKSESKTDFFNLGTGKGTSVKEIISLVRKYEPDFGVIKDQRRPGDPPFLIANANKAKKNLGWKIKYSIEDIIKDAFNWHSQKNL